MGCKRAGHGRVGAAIAQIVSGTLGCGDRDEARAGRRHDGITHQDATTHHPLQHTLAMRHHTERPTVIVSGAPDGRNKVTAGGRVDRRCTGHAQERKQKEGSNLRGGFGAGGGLCPSGTAVRPTQRQSLSTHSRTGNGSEGRADQRSIVNDDVGWHECAGEWGGRRCR